MAYEVAKFQARALSCKIASLRSQGECTVDVHVSSLRRDEAFVDAYFEQLLAAGFAGTFRLCGGRAEACREGPPAG